MEFSVENRNGEDQKKTDLPDADRAALIQAALEARNGAYVPYSHYAVGAALATPCSRR